ncbi:transcriptional regulator [Citrobacter amalonaticus]|uniref:Transcriptional regulator n=1 Tax=Citrobacter amalonaticus TaxID=35703 RepID=A0A2S4RQ26_CITAM|nr:PapB/FocB family fimbrial expression transcriptional regulator [Citrobacter amalonaticus]POT58541.1 transcriptional regulator [Citrobacter amalonaticus]POT75933.1 transcriptional regulator [Citrobacter amalonaticus]POU59105.1 transcriptional regulator [Citrobacter amalonaticus]POV05168.1 transcriptional regulator [Citrobacter amalonaticus]
MMADRAVLPCKNAHARVRNIPGVLEPGQVDICHFRLLMTLGRISKKNIQDALEDVLVRGVTQREACELHGISQSQFSVKFRQLQILNQTAARMYPFIAAGNVPSGM